MTILLLDIVTTAAILYVVAIGLLIVFGVMGIISFAHGAMLTIGGYAALLVTQAGLEPLGEPAGGGPGRAAGRGGDRARRAAARCTAGRWTPSSPPGASASSSAR